MQTYHFNVADTFLFFFFFFSSRRRHTRLQGDWSSDVCSSDLNLAQRDGIITGAGRYTVQVWVDTVQQAGPTYTVAVAGSYQAPAVTLRLQYQEGPGTAMMIYTGTLQDPQHLAGILNRGGDDFERVTFTRP